LAKIFLKIITYIVSGWYLLSGGMIVFLEPFLQLWQLRLGVEADPHPRLHVPGHAERVEPEARRSGQKSGRLVRPEETLAIVQLFENLIAYNYSYFFFTDIIFAFNIVHTNHSAFKDYS
jgi:hypothetical protein